MLNSKSKILTRFIPLFLVITIMVGIFLPVSLSSNKNGGVTFEINQAHAQTVYKSPNEERDHIGECDILDAEGFKNCIAVLFYYVPYTVGQYTLGLAAKAMDVSAGLTISSALYWQAGFINSGWRLTRDFANIFFILILLYIALSLVLGLSVGHANPKKMLASVIVIALFINFSMFITKIVIDASNTLALIFYNQIELVGKDKSVIPRDPRNDVTFLGVNIGVKPVSEAIVSAFRPQIFQQGEFYSCLSLSEKADGNDISANCGTGQPKAKIDGGLLVFIFLLAGIMYLFAAWAFLTAAFAFIGRMVGLWILIIFAPFAFVTYIIPETRHVKGFGWSDWWKTLISTAFAAPIFFFFLLLIALLSGSELFKQAATTSVASQIIISSLSFFVFIILLKKATDYVKKASGELGEITAKLGTGAVKAVGLATGGLAIGAALGGTAVLGRKTIGGVGRSLKSQSRRDLAAGLVTDKIRKQKKFAKMSDAEIMESKDFQRQSRRAQRVFKAGNFMASSSFDARNTGVAAAISSKTGMNMESFGALSTKSTAGGVEGVAAREAAKQRRFTESLGESHTRKVALEDVIADRKEKIADKQALIKQFNAYRNESNDQPGTAKGTAVNGTDETGATVSRTAVQWGDAARKLQEEIETLSRGNKNATRWEEKHVGTTQVDPTSPTGATFTVSASDVGKLKDPRLSVAVGDKLANGREAQIQDVGRVAKTEHLGLSALEKSLENESKARSRAFYHQKMQETGYEVHGAKFDAQGNLSRLGHIDTAKQGARDIRRVVADSIKRVGLGAMIGSAIGPVGTAFGALAGSALAASKVMGELFGNMNIGPTKYTDIFGRQGRTDAVNLASDLDHKIHDFKSTYKPPASGFFSFLKGVFEAGGGGDHGGGDAGHGAGTPDHH